MLSRHLHGVVCENDLPKEHTESFLEVLAKEEACVVDRAIKVFEILVDINQQSILITHVVRVEVESVCILNNVEVFLAGVEDKFVYSVLFQLSRSVFVLLLDSVYYVCHTGV